MERDPRVDPKAGDVFVKGSRWRKVTSIEPSHRENDKDRDDIRWRTATGKTNAMFRHHWVKWSKNAEVVHAADDRTPEVGPAELELAEAMIESGEFDDLIEEDGRYGA
jgi:hypothetical protein